MSTITFADVVHYSVSFSPDQPSDALVLELIGNKWVQRLRDISQTANTRLVYMFSEHSRFGHSLGVAYMAKLLMDCLAQKHKQEVEEYRLAVSAAALLHDLGHLAPGSHTAFKSWFPNTSDSHEELTRRIVHQDASFKKIFERYGNCLLEKTCNILGESAEVPAWTWEIISGGGWNVDRGNWCIVDSIMAGVTYGRYNIPAVTEAITITDSKHLALGENRLDAMTHFVVSRHAMYRQLYQHRVLLAADTINQAIVKRARDLGADLPFADETMESVLACENPTSLSLDTIFRMREPWWRYHLMRWRDGKDNILSELCERLLDRKLLKTVRINSSDNLDSLTKAAESATIKAGYDPRYYLHFVQTSDMHSSDRHHSMLVQMDDGRVLQLGEAEPLFETLVTETTKNKRCWLVMPAEAKQILGRRR